MSAYWSLAWREREQLRGLLLRQHLSQRHFGPDKWTFMGRFMEWPERDQVNLMRTQGGLFDAYQLMGDQRIRNLDERPELRDLVDRDLPLAARGDPAPGTGTGPPPQRSRYRVPGTLETICV